MKRSQVVRARRILRKFTFEAKVYSGESSTHAACQAWVTRQAVSGLSPKTVENKASIVRSFYGWIVRQGYMRANPFDRLVLPETDEPPPIWLTDAEVQQALRLSVQHGIFVEVLTAMNTGLRMTELRFIRWADVHLDSRQIVVPKAKGRRPRSVPLNGRMIAALAMHRKRVRESPFIFPCIQRRGCGARGHVWWEKALKPLQEAIGKFSERKAGSTGRGWHLLRHTFATRCCQRGIDIYTLSLWLGHRDVNMTKRYAHLVSSYNPEIERI